jgi:hypothetical protein
VNSLVALTTQRDEVVEALMAEPVVVAVVEVSVTKGPEFPADSTGRFDPMDRHEGVTPVPSAVQP